MASDNKTDGAAGKADDALPAARADASGRPPAAAGAVSPDVFVAIDFEKSGCAPHAVCSVGMVRVRNGRPEATFYSLVRPPSSRVGRTEIHGLTWEMLKDAPSLPEVWPRMREFCRGAQGFVAHDALNEFRTIWGSCRRYNLGWSRKPFYCTYKGATRCLPQAGFSLDKLCAYLGVELTHHNALSDAMGCAQIFMRMQGLGATLRSMRLGEDQLLPRWLRARKGRGTSPQRQNQAQVRAERARKKQGARPGQGRDIVPVPSADQAGSGQKNGQKAPFRQLGGRKRTRKRRENAPQESQPQQQAGQAVQHVDAVQQQGRCDPQGADSPQGKAGSSRQGRGARKKQGGRQARKEPR